MSGNSSKESSIRTIGILFLSLFTFMGQAAENNNQRFNLGVIDVIEVIGKPLSSTSWNDPVSATITSDELRTFERNNVAEAVNLLPGVTIQKLGGRSETLLQVRGFGSRQVPLFIDGIPVYVPYDGNVDLARFTTFDVSQISVTKAFTSMLYGANTLGGSVNLVSRRPSKKLEFDGGIGMVIDNDGDNNRQRIWGNAGTNQGDWYAQAGGSWLNRDHFTIADNFVAVPTEDGGRRENSAAEDYKFNFKIGYTPNETDEYALSYYNQQGEKHTPPYAGTNPFVRARNWRWPQWDKESLYFISNTALGGSEYVKVRAYYDKFDNILASYDDETYTTQNRPFAFTSIYDDYTLGGSVELGTVRFDGHALSAAFHYKRDVHRENDLGAPQERYEDQVLSFGIEDTITVTDRLNLIAGLSYSYQETLQADNLVGNTITAFPTDSADAINIQGGVFYDVTDNARVHVSIAKRTRFPTIKDKYSFRFGSALPNPGLQAEDAVHFEIGVDGRYSILEYGMNVFYSNLSDAIEDVTLPPTACLSPPCSQLQNIGKQHNRGVELLIGASLGDSWRFHANYTYLDRENRTPDVIPVDLPRHKFFAYAQYSPVISLDFIASAEFNSDRYSSTFGDRIAEDFTLINLKVTWRPMARVEADIGIDNIADELYAYEEGFPEPGRSYFANLKYSF